MSSTALLSLEGVTKYWGDRVIVEDLDFELRDGVITGIVGDNGVGKTTLMRIACGLITPQGGTVRYLGVDIEQNRPGYQRDIGVLSAGDRGLYARLTVRQNLELWGGLAGLSRRERRRRIGEVIDDFEVAELADRRVERLSMGQRQRVRLAMLFLHSPWIVFLDEPRTSLDADGVALLESALVRLADRGGAGLWVSHEPDEPLVTEAWVLRDHQLHVLPRDEKPFGAVEPDAVATEAA